MVDYDSDSDREQEIRVGGRYRTKVYDTKEKALKHFIKILTSKERGYSEKGAKMLFTKEEKKVDEKGVFIPLKTLAKAYLGLLLKKRKKAAKKAAKKKPVKKSTKKPTKK